MNHKRLIFICIPNLGHLSTELVHRLIYWSKLPTYDVKVYTPSGMLPLDNARSHCLQKFIEISNHDDDRLWFIDADIIPPMKGLDVLMAHDKDVCGLLCFMMKPDDSGQPVPLPVAVRYDENKQYRVYFDGKGLTEVDALGGGCIMTKRKVFEAIKSRPYVFHYYPNGELSLVGDYHFCQKVQEAGFKVWVDYNILCGHLKEVDLLAINNLMLRTG